MTEKDMFPLNPTLMRGLNDKIYEKRKAAALEIERWGLSYDPKLSMTISREFIICACASKKY